MSNAIFLLFSSLRLLFVAFAISVVNKNSRVNNLFSEPSNKFIVAFAFLFFDNNHLGYKHLLAMK